MSSDDLEPLILTMSKIELIILPNAISPSGFHCLKGWHPIHPNAHLNIFKSCLTLPFSSYYLRPLVYHAVLVLTLKYLWAFLSHLHCCHHHLTWLSHSPSGLEQQPRMSYSCLSAPSSQLSNQKLVMIHVLHLVVVFIAIVLNLDQRLTCSLLITTPIPLHVVCACFQVTVTGKDRQSSCHSDHLASKT